MENEKSRTSPLWWMLGSAAVGTVLGILIAPKKGSELRADIDEWRRKGRERSGALMRRVSAMIPLRVKVAAALGAVKAGAAEAVKVAKEDVSA